MQQLFPSVPTQLLANFVERKTPALAVELLLDKLHDEAAAENKISWTLKAKPHHEPSFCQCTKKE